MRTLLVLTLLAAGGACPIMDWLKDHGADVIETIKECKDVPAELKRAQDSDCQGKKSLADQVAFNLWYVLTAVEHLNGTIPDTLKKYHNVVDKVKALAAERVMTDTHQNVASFCEQEKCMDHIKRLEAAIVPCQASLMAIAMTKIAPFDKAQAIVEKNLKIMLPEVVNSQCQKDEIAGKDYYCSEMNEDIMLLNYDCFTEMKQAPFTRQCTQKCIKFWSGVKAKTLKCANFMEKLSQDMFKGGADLVKDIASVAYEPLPIGRLPKSYPSYDDVCGHTFLLENVLV